MPYIPPEVVAQAREMDLLTYLRTYEPQELVHFGGSTYCTREHDSLKISNGKWCWFSRGIGGYSALDYLIKVKEIPFTQAVETIMGNLSAAPPAFAPAPKTPKEKVLLLPQVNRSATHAVEYLHRRGIDDELISFCIQTGRLYESYPYHNVVFVGMDADGKPRYANQRGIGTDFIGDANGSDKHYSFGIPAAAASDTRKPYKGMIYMPILNVCNLCKTYQAGEAEVKALDNVSFTVEKGEFVSIIGPSGSGKSTLLHILAGIDRPTSGKVYVDGEDIYAKSEKELAYYRRRKAGLIYQFYNLVPTLTVEENITLPCRLDKKKTDKETLDRLLDTLGMKERRSHLPSQLSGGQQQRCAIGRVLFTNPALMLADEPTGNLDSKSAAEVMELLGSANKQYGQTLIMITHNLELAKLADRMLIIKDGKLSEG